MLLLSSPEGILATTPKGKELFSPESTATRTFDFKETTVRANARRRARSSCCCWCPDSDATNLST